ncbi:MAG: hypothetical protein LBI95_00190 [Holosporales bacterium]|nr:hypothetical protein [Holosporales bacterium]
MVYGLSRVGRRIHVMFKVGGWPKVLNKCSTWNILCFTASRIRSHSLSPARKFKL